jgi:hypothetical protein
MLRQGQPTGGTVGSTVDHLTFRVANLPRSIERWSKEAGIVVSPDGSIETPDGIRIRLLNDGSATARQASARSPSSRSPLKTRRHGT